MTEDLKFVTWGSKKRPNMGIDPQGVIHAVKIMREGSSFLDKFPVTLKFFILCTEEVHTVIRDSEETLFDLKGWGLPGQEFHGARDNLCPLCREKLE